MTDFKNYKNEALVKNVSYDTHGLSLEKLNMKKLKKILAPKRVFVIQIGSTHQIHLQVKDIQTKKRE